MTQKEIIMQAIREVAQSETPEKFAESNQTVFNVAEKALKIATPPIVSIAEQDGEKGVRLCVGDVDIFIEAHNLDNGEEFEWKKAMARLEEVGKRTFDKHEMYLIAAYKDEINAKLKEIGGDVLNGYYWSSTEGYSGNAWYVNFLSGFVYYGYLKYYSLIVRPCAAFKS